MSGQVLGIVPARLASTRLPNKPLYPLLGRPLIEWVWRRIAAMSVLDHAVVATDSEEVADICRGLGAPVEMTSSEPDCLYYGFSLCGNKLHCREGYKDASGALAHLDNVGSLLQELLGTGKIELKELQIHGPEPELAKLREPLAELNPTYWVLEYGFRR